MSIDIACEISRMYQIEENDSFQNIYKERRKKI